MWYDSQADFASVIRFENEGFNTKPYNSSQKKYGSIAYCHCFSFISKEVTDIDTSSCILPVGIKRVEPQIDDTVWSGCFVFLEHYDPKALENSLFIKANHKKNVALIDRQEKVWVRNINYKGNRIFKYVDNERGYYLLETCDEQDWVIMSVENALKRTRKSKEHFGYYREEITEIYLMEEQVKRLIMSPVSCPLMSMKELISCLIKVRGV
ncbi:hypothetical protein ABH966_004241 [Lysinibacillus sp. RC46]|uniref:hypothetical protein n=1 Tax=Lysinibacillus sp. RC46 TaxID=3156295 RepID=UPI003518C859